MSRHSDTFVGVVVFGSGDAEFQKPPPSPFYYCYWRRRERQKVPGPLRFFCAAKRCLVVRVVEQNFASLFELLKQRAQAGRGLSATRWEIVNAHRSNCAFNR